MSREGNTQCVCGGGGEGSGEPTEGRPSAGSIAFFNRQPYTEKDEV